MNECEIEQKDIGFQSHFKDLHDNFSIDGAFCTIIYLFLHFYVSVTLSKFFYGNFTFGMMYE